MRGVVFRFSITVLTFALGWGVSKLAFHKTVPQANTVESEETNRAQQPVEAPPKYQVRTMAKGNTGPYPSYSTDLFTADGTGYFLTTTDYDSPERANRQLQRVLKKATKIISSEPVLMGKDWVKVTIATFPAKSEYGPASVLWTDESMFRFVNSSSVKHVQEYTEDVKQKNSLFLHGY